MGAENRSLRLKYHTDEDEKYFCRKWKSFASFLCLYPILRTKPDVKFVVTFSEQSTLSKFDITSFQRDIVINSSNLEDKQLEAKFEERHSNKVDFTLIRYEKFVHI